LGPVELWALSTSVEDVLLRGHLYTALGAPVGRKVLAKYFPAGSARQEVRRRVVSYTEKGEIEASATSAVILEMAQELIRAVREDPAKVEDVG